MVSAMVATDVGNGVSGAVTGTDVQPERRTNVINIKITNNVFSVILY
jgi:hypothetical protein